MDEEEEREVLILYGTETGNAQDYAEMTAKRCQRLRFGVEVKAMDDATLNDLVQHTVVLVLCSTTGQGELPRNALKLWKQLLRKKLIADVFEHVNIATFGLGDSSYPRFNWAIRKIHKRLVQLGCVEFAPRGEGDEQHSEGSDVHFDSWLNKMSDRLIELWPLPKGIEPIPGNQLLEPRMTLKLDYSSDKREYEDTKKIAVTRPHVDLATVQANDRITDKDHFQDVRHMKFETDAEGEYTPGDTIALYPSNKVEEVDLLIKHQQWTDIADCPVQVNDEFLSCVPGGVVTPLTIRNLLIHHLDIASIPRRSFFDMVHHFATGDEQERLEEFASLDGLQDLFDYANRPKRSILETILEFSTLKIPVRYLLDVVPVLRPRLFSICSPAQSLHKFELVIGIVKYRTIIRRIRRGCCTRWIEQTLQLGDRIPFTLQKSALPQALDKPVVMVAPGTGVAPMRALIHSRLQAHVPHEMALFFGCRFKAKDFLFEGDWRQAAKRIDSNELPHDDSPLSVYCAFSRDTEKRGGGYVQEKLYLRRQEVGRLVVDQNATVYICGSSGAMPRQVRISLVEIVRLHKQCSEEEADAYLKDMETLGRYLQETWD